MVFSLRIFIKKKRFSLPMLYDILKDRKAVNLLKYLYDAKDTFSIEDLGVSKELTKNLADHGLVYFENDKNGKVALSLRGKQFIEIFDELKSIVEANHSPPKMSLSFNLSEKEKEILLYLSKNEFESEVNFLFTLLKKEGTITSKNPFLRILEDLKNLNLLSISGKTVKMTRLGKRTVKQELLKEFNLES